MYIVDVIIIRYICNIPLTREIKSIENNKISDVGAKEPIEYNVISHVGVIKIN